MGKSVYAGMLIAFLLVACLSAPGMGKAQVVDDGMPNIHPWLAVSMIEQQTGILPVYNVTGQECYSLFVAAGRDMSFVSLREGEVFPVYNVSDVRVIYEVKYPEAKFPVLSAVLGGPFTSDKKMTKCFQIVAGSTGPEVYSWEP
ncbi:MAG: hypothetical protein WA103_03145 [Minisyncoccales bacterium]